MFFVFLLRYKCIQFLAAYFFSLKSVLQKSSMLPYFISFCCDYAAVFLTLSDIIAYMSTQAIIMLTQPLNTLCKLVILVADDYSTSLGTLDVLSELKVYGNQAHLQRCYLENLILLSCLNQGIKVYQLKKGIVPILLLLGVDIMQINGCLFAF